MKSDLQKNQLTTQSVRCRCFWLKFWLVAWVGCCVILGSIFYMNIRHQQRIDKIWEKYEQDIKTLHNSN